MSAGGRSLTEAHRAAMRAGSLRALAGKRSAAAQGMAAARAWREKHRNTDWAALYDWSLVDG